MKIEEQYRKPNPKSELVFYLNSDNLEANVKYIKDKQIDSLMLIPNENGYNLKDIDFLKELPFIKTLHMGACDSINNYDGLLFVEELVSLGISPQKKVSVDLSKLTKLKQIGFLFTSKIKGLDKLIEIEEIKVWSADKNFLNVEIFKNYINLKDLLIYQSNLNDGLSFLKENKKIEYLEFSHIRNEFNIEGIQYLKNNLKKLKFISSKKIKNIELVSKLKNLEWLIFSDSVTLQSADIVSDLHNLEALSVGGSSYFIDGDLRELKHMRDTIKYYTVRDKKHYFYE